MHALALWFTSATRQAAASVLTPGCTCPLFLQSLRVVSVALAAALRLYRYTMLWLLLLLLYGRCPLLGCGSCHWQPASLAKASRQIGCRDEVTPSLRVLLQSVQSWLLLLLQTRYSC